MPELPLTDRELRIVRGMIDEAEYRRARRRFLRDSFGELRIGLLVLSGMVVLTIQVVTLILLLATGHTP